MKFLSFLLAACLFVTSCSDEPATAPSEQCSTVLSVEDSPFAPEGDPDQYFKPGGQKDCNQPCGPLAHDKLIENQSSLYLLFDSCEGTLLVPPGSTLFVLCEVRPKLSASTLAEFNCTDGFCLTFYGYYDGASGADSTRAHWVFGETRAKPDLGSAGASQCDSNVLLINSTHEYVRLADATGKTFLSPPTLLGQGQFILCPEQLVVVGSLPENVRLRKEPSELPGGFQVEKWTLEYEAVPQHLRVQ